MYLKNCMIIKWRLEDDLRTTGCKGAVFGVNFIRAGNHYRDYVIKIIANVSYMYNYEGCPYDGYYWVDSYNESTISFIPPEPTREGYTFAGWYKEATCINAWDFATDNTGKVIDVSDTYDNESALERYDGINLYAKWTEKNAT